MQTITAYHGTAWEFEEFDSYYKGMASGGCGTSHMWFFAQDKEHAEHWGEKSAITSQFNHWFLLTVEIKGNAIELDGDEFPFLDDVAEQYVREDYDIIIYHNARDDESMVPRTMYCVFDDDAITIIKRELIMMADLLGR